MPGALSCDNRAANCCIATTSLLQDQCIEEVLQNVGKHKFVIRYGRSAIGHFLLVGNWSQVSISNHFQDICI